MRPLGPAFGGTRLAPRAAAGRDDASLQRLMDEHFDFIWRLLRRLGLCAADADDGVQQVFIVASEKLPQIVAGNERTFLYGTALRVASNARRSARRRGALRELHSERELERESPHEALEHTRAQALLDEVLELLPDDLRRVLVLAEIEQLSVPEIAQLERLAVGTAASRLRRARERFRELLETVKHRNPFAREAT